MSLTVLIRALENRNRNPKMNSQKIQFNKENDFENELLESKNKIEFFEDKNKTINLNFWKVKLNYLKIKMKKKSTKLNDLRLF